MRKYRFVALTDHSDHSAENSIYAILSELARHPRTQSVELVTRGLSVNKSFFEGEMEAPVHAYQVSADFSFDDSGTQYSDSHALDLNACDIILMRLPRPIPDQFLEKLSSTFGQKLIVNDPRGILETSNKSFLLNFQELCPPVRLCRSIKDIKEFASQFDLVLKPLKEYGGKGILKIKQERIHDGEQYYNTDEYLSTLERYINEEGFLAMKFLKNVHLGDKRLLVVDGEILASSLRLPAKDSWLCNVSQGGRSVSSKPDSDEMALIDKIHPVMKQAGVMIYGVDTLVGDEGRRLLSEINTMSIGGFKQAQEQSGKPIISAMLNKIFKYADEKYEN